MQVLPQTPSASSSLFLLLILFGERAEAGSGGYGFRVKIAISGSPIPSFCYENTALPDELQCKNEKGGPPREILPFISPHPTALAWGDVSGSYGLLPGRASRHGSCRRLRLRNAQVSGGAVLGYLVDDQLQRRAAAVRVEVNRLVHGAILLLEAVVVGVNHDCELVPLGVGAAQLHLDVADLLHAALAIQREFEVVALAHPADRKSVV